MPPIQRLAAWLLWLKHHHDNEAWTTYAALLPGLDDCRGLMTFSDEELAELQDEGAAEAGRRSRQAVAELHDAVFSASTGSLLELALARTADDTLWAVFCANSRAFGTTGVRRPCCAPASQGCAAVHPVYACAEPDCRHGSSRCRTWRCR